MNNYSLVLTNQKTFCIQCTSCSISEYVVIFKSGVISNPMDDNTQNIPFKQHIVPFVQVESLTEV